MNIEMPEWLAERHRVLDSAPLHTAGEFVLYWMHNAVRVEDNPALEVAIWLGNALSIPVLVYQGLGKGHRFDSDRHHAFILQGAREVAVDLAARGLRHVFHLPLPTDQSTPLTALAQRAAAVVVEDYPAPPFPTWVQALRRRAGVPLHAVDTCCVVPMRFSRKAPERAFAFRRQFEAVYTERLAHGAVPQIEPQCAPWHGELGFVPLEWQQGSIAQWCAQSAIDHTIAPLADHPGGRRAALARWRTFCQNGLATYADLRNDAAVLPPKGVSRLSPYLHYGHIAAAEIAREATDIGGKGAEKFLDELLIWRELSHHFCFHCRDPERLEALPSWAQRTLHAHAHDPRSPTYTWEQLARGSTHSELWNEAQRSLRVHGELHNNVRMSWGKALVEWTDTPERALAYLIDLNHRYALDGNDPNSYGGLLWCLGLFDRPFKPEQPVLGQVRPRSLRAHERRLPIAALRQRLAHTAPKRLKVAVIGAGLAGAIAARSLYDQDHAVQVFEKARGAGGRCATRRNEIGAFDHGAQYFTLRDARLQPWGAAWAEAGLIAPWQPQRPDAATRQRPDETHWVGVPSMNALCRHLVSELDVRYSCRIEALQRDVGQWWLAQDEGTRYGPFDAVLVSAPAPQCHDLLATAGSPLAARAAEASMAPCWALMVQWAMPLPHGIEAQRFEHPVLSWLSAMHSRPGRQHNAYHYVLHASHAWSRQHLEDDPAQVEAAMLAALAEALGTALPPALWASAHRWRYALAEQVLDEDALWDLEVQLGACGDWCRGGRIEDALLSGQAAAGRVMSAHVR